MLVKEVMGLLAQASPDAEARLLIYHPDPEDDGDCPVVESSIVDVFSSSHKRVVFITEGEVLEYRD